MTSLARLALVGCLLVASLPGTARAMPVAPDSGPGGDTVIVEEGTPGGPLEVVEQAPPPELVPPPDADPHTDLFSPERDERLWRAERGLTVERWGTIIGPIGIAMSVIGVVLRATATDAEDRDAGTTAMLVGYGTAGTFMVIGGSGAMVASGQLRHLGISPHRRGLATASLVFSVIPGGQFIGWLMMVVHRRTTLTVCRSQPRSPNGPSFSFRPWIDPAVRGAGSGLVLRF